MSTTTAVTYELDGDVAIITLDDGKANAISHEIITGIDRSLDRAADEGARAIVLMGRPGRFSAGFDLTTMRSGPQEARDLLEAGALMALRIYQLDMPVVLGVSGHALAMGAILLLAADTRIGTAGEFKIGLNEVNIGMPVPVFAVELARDRLSPRHLTRAINHARIFDPVSAVEAGYLDMVVDADVLKSSAVEHAHALASDLDPAAFSSTRKNLRGELARSLSDSLRADIATFSISGI